MSTAVVNIASLPRRHRRGRRLGDLFDNSDQQSGDQFGAEGGGGGVATDPVQLPQTPAGSDTIYPPGTTVSAKQLQQENDAGDFNDLQTPEPYFGANSGQYNDPYGNPTIFGYGPNGSAFITYTPDTEVSPTGPIGGGGGVQARYPVTGVANPLAAIPVANSTAPSGLASSVEGWFSTPIYAGSSITWGWALLGGLALWLLMRNN